MKTASAMGFRAGSQSSVYARADVTEIPKSFFVTAARGRLTSTVHPICNPDGCPDPPPPPDPTPGPNGFYDGGSGVISSGSTTQAESIAATRHLPCTQTFTTNNYPGGVAMSFLGAATWALDYKPGYPYFDGGTDTADVTRAVKLVDGTLLENVTPQLVANNQQVRTTFTYTADPITTLKYVAIKVVEHPYPADNVIMGEANVSCAGDTVDLVDLASLLKAWINPPPVQP